MCSQKLCLIDLSKPPDLAVLHKLRQSLFRFGAFRITAPAATQLLSEDVFQKANLWIYSQTNDHITDLSVVTTIFQRAL